MQYYSYPPPGPAPGTGISQPVRGDGLSGKGSVMKKVDVIVRRERSSSPALLRAAAYCRVSTAREDQLNSLSNQRNHYERLVCSHSDWILAGIYEDAGISASHGRERDALDRMIRDCRMGKIDIVLTKSISRLSRNTCECIDIVRKLQSFGVAVIFEKEQIDTRTMEGELLLSILSSMAQDEARSISENCRWTVRRQFMDGSFKLSRAPYGYVLEDGVLSVDPAEADIVRQIFERCASGEGTPSIAAFLNEQQISTKRSGRWSAGTVLHMIRNEFYVGDLRMQKTWRDDDYRIHLNHGEQAQYYCMDHHPAIISPALFEKANEAASARDTLRKPFQQHSAAMLQRSSSEKDEPDPRQNRYCCSGKLICANCGSPLIRKMRRRNGVLTPGWVCRNHHHDPASCMGTWHLSDELKTSFLQVVRALAGRYSHIPENYLKRNIETMDIRLPLLEQQMNQRRRNAARLGSDYTRNRRQYIRLQQEQQYLSLTKKQMISQNNICRLTIKMQERLSETIQLCGSNRAKWSAPEISDSLFEELIDHASIDQTGETWHFLCGLKIRRDQRGLLHEV